MSEMLKKTSFDSHLNSTFNVQLGSEESTDLELIEITDTSNESIEGFSLIFKGPLDKPFIQRIYKLQHPKMGELEIFLVPIIFGKKDAMYYQAVFNRLLE